MKDKTGRISARGFSLIEVVGACVILVLMTGLMLEIFRQGLVYAKRTKERSFAVNLARQGMERTMALFFADLASGEAEEEYGSITDYPDFKRVTTIEDYLYPNELKSIRVAVFWESDRRNVTLVTLKSNYFD